MTSPHYARFFVLCFIEFVFISCSCSNDWMTIYFPIICCSNQIGILYFVSFFYLLSEWRCAWPWIVKCFELYNLYLLERCMGGNVSDSAFSCSGKEHSTNSTATCNVMNQSLTFILNQIQGKEIMNKWTNEWKMMNIIHRIIRGMDGTQQYILNVWHVGDDVIG